MRLIPPALPVLLLLLAGCAGAPSTGGGTGGANLRPQPGVERGTAWQGDTSTVAERLETVARTPEEWRALWAKAGVAAPESLSGDQMAVAIFLGARASGGHAVILEAPAAAGSGVVVPYRETVPGPNDPVDQTPTAPFAIRLVDAKPGAVSFVLAK